MSRPEFRDTLQVPLARKLETDGLWRFGNFTNAATNGQPERVRPPRGRVQNPLRRPVLRRAVENRLRPGHARAGQHQLPPQFQRNEAAVDSELAWLPAIEMKPPLDRAVAKPILRRHKFRRRSTRPTASCSSRGSTARPPASRAAWWTRRFRRNATGLWGRAYFDARGLEKTNSYYLGDEWILGAAQISRALGFETVVDDKPDVFPARFSHEPDRDLRRVVCGQRQWAVPTAEGRIHARRVRVSFAFVQRGRPFADANRTGSARCSPKARPARWAACMNRIFPSRQTSRCFSHGSPPASSPLARPRGPRNRRSPGRPPSSATRFTGHSANRRRHCMSELTAAPQPACRMA